ncbi:Cyclin-dependent kinase 17 [Collichthys lucidus]|uniref:Cyclin-dependent kinase 17 n=1 Tax=Collichthys lucidus TaxID=240159 RepID=A0A4U5UT22_COLLU|nr:Cyclin-dependent kinase 17 [Collichthys lucidus]
MPNNKTDKLTTAERPHSPSHGKLLATSNGGRRNKTMEPAGRLCNFSLPVPDSPPPGYFRQENTGREELTENAKGLLRPVGPGGAVEKMDRMKIIKRRLSMSLRSARPVDDSLSELAEQMALDEPSTARDNERDKDKEAAGGEDGRSKKEREDEGDKGTETECKKEADRAENVVTGS